MILSLISSMRLARRMDVAMGGVPEARLVVEDVVAQAAVCVRAPACHQVLHPGLLDERGRRHVGLGWIVADDVLAVGPYAVARIGHPLRVAACLRAVFAIEKLASLLRFDPTFATQSISGMVSIGLRVHRLRAREKPSPRSPGMALGSAMLSKYQSLPRLSAFTCQL